MGDERSINSATEPCEQNNGLRKVKKDRNHDENGRLGINIKAGCKESVVGFRTELMWPQVMNIRVS
jgi:hypothetical protein